MKNNFYLPCHFFENRRSMRVLLFLRMIDLTEHFIVKQKSILKHQKLLLHDITSLGIKNPLKGKDQKIRGKIALCLPKLQAYLSLASFAFYRLIGYKHFPEYFFNFVRFYVIIHQKIDLKRSSTYRCPFYWESEAFICWTNKKKTITRLFELLRSQLHK